jgi:hypothetical protein
VFVKPPLTLFAELSEMMMNITENNYVIRKKGRRKKSKSKI